MTFPSTSPRRRALCLSLASLLVPVALTGCAGFQTTASPSLPGAQSVTLTGSVKGGQQPVGNAQIYLFTPGTSGYGSASASLLNTNGNGSTTAAPGSAYVSTGGLNGADYVTTNASGQFTITGDFSCPSTTAQVYALAYSGNPTGSSSNTVNNTAIALISPVGQCSTLGTNFIAINELTTAATVTALQQFMVDATHVGTSSTNTQGLINAFAIIPDIVSITAGTPNSTNVAGTGTVPTAKLNELGNILSTCVNTSDPTTGGCPALFSATATAAATSVNDTAAAVSCPGSTGCPTDTVQAMLQIAQNPTQNVAAIHALPTQAQLPFGPDGAAPNDYGIDITFAGNSQYGIYYPQSLAIDANGNAFVSCAPSTEQGNSPGTDAIIGISPRGVYVAAYQTDLSGPSGIAFDRTGALWSTNVNNNSVVKQTGATIAPGFPYTTNLSTPIGVALDVNGNAWVTNETGGSVVQISGSTTDASNNNQATLLATVNETLRFGPVGVGIDNQGFVYVAGAGANQISRFSSTGTGNVKYSNSALSQPSSIALDNSNNVWSWNQSGVISELVGATGAATGANGDIEGVQNSEFLAIDGAGTAWIPNCNQTSCGSNGGPDNIIHVATNGASLNDSANNATSGHGLQDPSSLNGVGTLAFDGSGNLWVTNAFGNSVTEYLGVAAPVLTPLVSAVAAGKLGARP